MLLTSAGHAQHIAARILCCRHLQSMAVPARGRLAETQPQTTVVIFPPPAPLQRPPELCQSCPHIPFSGIVSSRLSLKASLSLARVSSDRQLTGHALFVRT